MEEEEGGIRLSKRFDGEVDYKLKAGTAWSHSYLNQKPWHPLSYPNQRRKWIAEQTHAQRQRRAHQLAREYAQEQDFLRQTSLLSHKEKEKVDMMQAVSFMYVRPPGYNAESAKAAEVADERKKQGENNPSVASSSSMPQQTAAAKEEKRKPRPKDVFGRHLPTEEEFAVLKNAPRLETGVLGRAKPFAVEVRNVKCVRCGNFGHQSGDRECPLKDVIMPNEENRLKRDDPLTAIKAHVEPSEPLKWELKQRPGISPPRGGFMPDDPNQQIVAEDIFDEYGGFLSGGGIPELLTNFSPVKHKRKKSKNKSRDSKRLSSKRGHDGDSSSESGDIQRTSRSKSKHKAKDKKQASPARSAEGDDYYLKKDRHQSRSKSKEHFHRTKKKKRYSSDSSISDDSESDDDRCRRRSKRKEHSKRKKRYSSDSSISDDSESDNDRYRRRTNREDAIHKSRRKTKELSCSSSSSEDSESRKSHRKSRYKHSRRTEHHGSDKLGNDSSSHQKSRAMYEGGSSDSGSKCTNRDKTHTSSRRVRDESGSSAEGSERKRHRLKGRPKQLHASQNFDSTDHGSRHHRRRHDS